MAGGDPLSAGPARQKVKDGEFDRLKKLAAGWKNASLCLDLTCDANSPHIEISTNANPMATVYVAATFSGVRISWRFNELVQHDGLESVNVEQLANRLMMHSIPYSDQTIYTNIRRIPINSIATITKAGLKIWSLDRREQYAPRLLTDAVHTRGVLYDLITLAIARRELAPDRVACELSGGLDSSVCTLAASSLMQPITVAGIIESKEHEKQQTLRLQGIASALSANTILVHVKDHMPFMDPRFLDRAEAINRFSEPFYEVFWHLTEKLVSDGYDTVITGTGGNEAFPLYANEPNFDNQLAGITHENERPSFLTTKTFNLSRYAQVSCTSAFGYHASAVQAVEARLQRTLKQGVWPINPFLEPEIIQFASSLPFQERYDRTIIRSILAANGLEAFSSDTYVSFEGAATEVGLRTVHILRLLCRNSVCEELGLVNTRKLLEEYDQCSKSPPISDRDRQTLFHIIVFMQAEAFLQQFRRN